jgi:hypothetical protein
LVTPADWEFRKSTRTVSSIASLGDHIDQTAGGIIDQKGENNIYGTAQSPETQAGSTKYRIIYVKYKGTDTPIKDCSFIQFFDTPDRATQVQWAFDPLSSHPLVGRPFIKLDGIDDNIDCGDQAALWSQSKTKFSFSIWISANAWGNGGALDIVRHDSSSNHRFVLESVGSNNLEFNIKNSGGTIIRAGAGSSITLRDWHYVTCTYDNSLVSQNLKIYVDGVLKGTADLTEAISLTGVLKIGSSTDPSPACYVKDFRYWVNKALTQSEITDIYNGAGDGITPSYWLKMNEDTGNPVDTISGSLVGTLTAGAAWASSQALTNENTAPFGSVTYQDVSNDVPSPANIGDFKTNQYIPVILKYILAASSLEVSIENDTSDFRLYYGIQSNQGGGGGEGGGTPPSSVTDTVIIYNADWDGNTKTAEMVADAQEESPVLVLSGGDNSYATSESGFYQRIKPVDDNQGSSIRFETAIGNHDDENNKLSETFAHFGYTVGYYSFQIENVHVLVLDSENSPTGATQVNFAENDLKNARLDSNIDWIIVVFHRPFYTANSKHDPDESNMRATYQPKFDTYKVDLVLQGHNHNIQRTFPVTNKAHNDPNIVTTSQGPYTGWQGVIFVIDGTGGHDSGSALYSLGNSPAFNAYQQNSKNMNLKIALSNNGKTLTCSFINQEGGVEHSWIMTR